MSRFKLLPSPPMFVACVALLFALSGTGYAAFKLPRNSVTTAHVKDGTLLARDFRAGQLPSVRWVEVLPSGTIAGQSGGIRSGASVAGTTSSTSASTWPARRSLRPPHAPVPAAVG